MAIISRVGKKNIKIRILNLSIHLILILGAITMVYPFLTMFSGSFKSAVDSKNIGIIPEYFYNDEVLFKKYVESRFNKESINLGNQYKNKFPAFEYVKRPKRINPPLVNDWLEFIRKNKNSHTEFDYYVSEHYGRDMYPRNQRAFINAMKEETNGDMNLFNKRYNTSIDYWNALSFNQKNINNQNYSGNSNELLRRFGKFSEKLPIWHRVYASVDGNFIQRQLIPICKGKLDILNQKLGTDYKTWNEINIPHSRPKNSLRTYWDDYVKNSLNAHNIMLSEAGKRNFLDFLEEKYDGIKLLNKTYKNNYSQFEDIEIPERIPVTGAFLSDWKYFITKIAKPQNILIRSIENDFREFLANKYNSVENLNRQYQHRFEDFSNVELYSGLESENLQYKKDWIYFLKNKADIENISLKMTSKKEFTDFLKREYNFFDEEEFIAEINLKLGTDFEKVINIYPSKQLPDTQKAQYQTVWKKFVRNFASPEFLEIEITESTQAWQNFLKEKYGNIGNLNNSYHLIYKDFQDVGIDFHQIDYQLFKNNQTSIFYEFLTRNYKIVFNEMVTNGRALLNTLIYCALAIFVALIVNPLAAYALSRFNLKSRYKIILILMLTMAFPPMVLAIPNFLLLKNLNLFNTFWALILPGAADGYFIFLLKGFFDSLPQELYESATIDGANEMRIFSQITIPLSKPILAVIALNAFNAAYRNFMFAFLVCQDKSMWTIMVHMYQLMQRSTQGIGFAAVTLAAVLPLIVFIFSQKFILKGIVVPSEK